MFEHERGEAGRSGAAARGGGGVWCRDGSVWFVFCVFVAGGTLAPRRFSMPYVLRRCMSYGIAIKSVKQLTSCSCPREMF